jgi:hypothetical protein
VIRGSGGKSIMAGISIFPFVLIYRIFKDIYDDSIIWKIGLIET